MAAVAEWMSPDVLALELVEQGKRPAIHEFEAKLSESGGLSDPRLGDTKLNLRDGRHEEGVKSP